MRVWTLQKINELWVLQDDNDRERKEHRVYGTDWELGQFLVEAANAWEQRGQLPKGTETLGVVKDGNVVRYVTVECGQIVQLAPGESLAPHPDQIAV